MIQLVLNSPFLNQDLEQALRYRQAEDPLVLMQDAVVAVVAPEWCERLAGIPLYVMEEDLRARGLPCRIGMELDMPGLISLIAEHGSPQTWAG
ncbi:sulfurtransferase complex subunit TusB [Aeromonas sp. sia0103]|uniref:sulfurtransferase complex subunit TusB n=1 Tax=Aeromonas sp. sia0103 TaxID=2854782 RepID=UPI001C48C64E|nr:sulfurtransferase complex subunit TusB [Aeromonas sp. sia0103]MBV7599480.1 sulfurtransferase complex subunit TusB [Aeromonas sp. sia0103]